MWADGNRLIIKSKRAASPADLPTHSSNGSAYRSGSSGNLGHMSAPLLPHSMRQPRRTPSSSTCDLRRLLLQLTPSIIVLMFVVPALMWYGPCSSCSNGPPVGPPNLVTAADLEQQNTKLAAGNTSAVLAADGSAAGVVGAAKAAAAEGAALVVPKWRRRPRLRKYVDGSDYLIDPEPRDMRAQHKLVKAYVESDEYRVRQEERKVWPRRGIVINAGGRIFLSSTVVQLKVLREVLNCTLPVELVWHGPGEMDAATLASFEKHFAPLRGYDITKAPYPKHHKKEGVKLDRFEGKVLSVLLARFQEVLLMDADNVPLVNPETLFDNPDYMHYGNLFWPDYWSVTERKDLLYDMVGLKMDPAKRAIDEGRGGLIRDTESGQLLLNLNMHADVAEYLFWINSFSEQVYRAVWGDKDTFPVAFGAAGKASLFVQNQVPPGVLFHWKDAMLLIRATNQRVPGWMLIGMLQFDPLGRPAFMHRTIDKFRLGGQPSHIGLITGPLPYRWVHYYIHQQAIGPTVGVPWDYVAPDSAFLKWTLNPLMALVNVTADGRNWEQKGPFETCPVATFHDYRAMRELGLPVGANATLDAACALLLEAQLGAAYAAYKDNGYLEAPEALQVARGGYDVLAKDGGGREVPDGTPVAAWVPDYMSPTIETPTSRAFKGAYEAFEWLKAHANEFPKIRDGP